MRIAYRNNVATPRLASTVATKEFAMFCAPRIAPDRLIAAREAANALTKNAASRQTHLDIKLN
jgi:hypothetical protein